MNADDAGLVAGNDVLTSGDRSFVVLWTLGILMLYAASGLIGAHKLVRYRQETTLYRQAWEESATTEPDAAPPEITPGSGGGPTDVTVGLRINSIGEFGLNKSDWLADFDVWFLWPGDTVSPGEHFQVVNGDIEGRELEEAFEAGGRHYERYNVRARLVFNLDAGRFPFNDQALTIQIEDGADSAGNLRYVPDESDSGVNPRGLPSSLKITRTLATAKFHSYRSKRGDPRLAAGEEEVHSRFIFAFLLAPPGAPLFVKLFQALFASVAISFAVFFIKPIHVDPRFGLGVGAFFAAIGNNIYIGSILPYAQRLGLPDMVNAIGLGTIFLTLVQSTASLYIFDTLHRVKLRRLFDHASFWAFLARYVAVNLALIFAAGS